LSFGGGWRSWGRGMDRIEGEIEVQEIFLERKEYKNTRIQEYKNTRIPVSRFRSRVFLWTGGCDQGFFSSALGLKTAREIPPETVEKSTIIDIIVEEISFNFPR
jgi:hypothetical protein